MERIPRALDDLDALRRPGRVTVIHGPRQVGKTNLVQHYLAGRQERVLSVTGDDVVVRNLLAGQDAGAILGWAEGHSTVVIDEAQRIPDVGWALKILIDARPELNLIATGSASFVLAGQVGEPLTGRQTPLTLFPVATSELANRHNAHELRAQLDNFLVYGMYPEVRAATSDRDRRDIVLELTRSYLFKDILELERIKSSKRLVDLLTLVALQVGNLVSFSELGTQVGLDTKTVGRYLGLLEQCHVLFNLRGFSRNLRSEITKTSKWYFFDVGVRNALLNNFNPPGQRDDVGALWENFMVLERRKALAYAGRESPLYFWRTWEQQEVDLIEDRDGALHAHEFKWNPHAKVRRPARFLETYPDADFTVVTPATYVGALQV
ncbi:MAG: ATP-binding protein [Propionibacteriaceae bacterium]|nr:ATP-binding protein [Propionibacteriaceae bacterium]